MMNQLMQTSKKKLRNDDDELDVNGGMGSRNTSNEYYYSSQEIQNRRQQERQHMLANTSNYNHRESLHDKFHLHRGAAESSSTYSNTSALLYGYTEVLDRDSVVVAKTDDLLDDVALNDSTHGELNDIFDHVILSRSTSNRKAVISDGEEDNDEVDDLYSDAISVAHSTTFPNEDTTKDRNDKNSTAAGNGSTSTPGVQRRSVISAAAAEIALSNSFDRYCEEPIAEVEFDNHTTMTPIISNHIHRHKYSSRNHSSDRSNGSRKSHRSSKTTTSSSRNSTSGSDDGRISAEQRRQRLRQYEKQMRGCDDILDDESVRNNDQLPTVEQYKTWNGISKTSSSRRQRSSSKNGKSMLDRFLLRTTAGSRSRNQHKELEQEEQNIHEVDKVADALDSWQRQGHKRSEKTRGGFGKQDDGHDSSQLPNVEEYKAAIGFRTLTKGIGTNNKSDSTSNNRFGNIGFGSGKTKIIPSLPLRRSAMGDDSQLPSVEEYKTSVYASSRNSVGSYLQTKNRRRRMVCIGLILFLFVTIIGIFVTLNRAASPKSIIDRSKGVDDGTTAMMVNDVFAAKDDSLRVAALIRLITYKGWSEPMSFLEDITGINNTMRSSQYTAAKWLSSSLSKYSAEIVASPMITSTYLMERYALAVFYYSTGGPTVWNYQHGFLSRSDPALHVCDWNDVYATRGENSTTGSNTTGDGNNNDNEQKVGVLCDTNPDTAPIDNDDYYRNSTYFYHISAITRLYMPSNNLYGTIPSEIRLLSNLRELNLYNNKIGSTLPSQIAQLSNLQSLIMFDNRLKGTIPTWLSSMPNLRIVNMGKNKELSGTLPNDIHQSTSLQVLNFEKCSINGDIKALHGLSSLQALHLASNKLSGPFTNDLFESLSSLIELDISSNQFTGLPPKGLLSNTKLMVIDIHDNGFAGNIARDLSAVSPSSNVRVISLRNNNFTGPLTPWIHTFNADVIQHIGVSNNMFTGTLPSEIGTLTNLKFLYIARNKKLNASAIPTQFGKLTKLQDLSLQSSNVVGTIPTELAKLKQLVLFDLNDNNLSGYIPFEFGSGMKSLRFLLLSHNKLEGIIPDTFQQLVLLDSLLLNNNNFTGTTNSVCHPKIAKLRVFKADCMKFITGCTCCSTCCDEADTLTEAALNSNASQKRQSYCDAKVFFPELDPSGEYNYVRTYYKSRESDIIFPVASTPDAELPLYDPDNNSIFGSNATNGVLPTSSNHKKEVEHNPFNFGPLSVLINNTIPSSQTAYGPYGNNAPIDQQQTGGGPSASQNAYSDNEDRIENDYDDDTTDYDDDYTDDGGHKNIQMNVADDANDTKNNESVPFTPDSTEENGGNGPSFAEVIDVYDVDRSESSGP
jgi:Leucine-rich repeat (LRR) protein